MTSKAKVQLLIILDILSIFPLKIMVLITLSLPGSSHFLVAYKIIYQ